MSIIRAFNIPETGSQTFREAWWDETTDQFVVNHGTVGFESETPVVQDGVSQEEGERLLDAFILQCEEDGYRQVPEEEQWWVTLRFPLKNADPSQREASRGRTVAAALRGHLAWRGLGTVEAPIHQDRVQLIKVLTTAPRPAAKAITTCVREVARPDLIRLKLTRAPGARPSEERPLKI